MVNTTTQKLGLTLPTHTDIGSTGSDRCRLGVTIGGFGEGYQMRFTIVVA